MGGTNTRNAEAIKHQVSPAEMSKNALTETGSRAFGLNCQSGIHNFIRSKLERKIKLFTFSTDIMKAFHLPVPIQVCAVTGGFLS